MSSVLSSPFQDDTIREVVPNSVKVAGKLSSANVITGRRRVRIIPQSGQTYALGSGSAQTVNFLIQDGQAYADLLSATVSFNLTTNSTTGTDIVVPDDGAYSVFRRALVSVNSTLMDDCDFVAKKANAEIYATAGQDWYDNVGTWLGLWKFNLSQYNYVSPATDVNPTAMITKYGISSKLAEWRKRVQTGVSTPLAAQAKFSIPVSLLSGFFRNEMLFPSRNCGQLYLQLNLASLQEALFASNNTLVANPAGTVSATLSNMTLELDFCDLHPTYLSMMDELMDSDGLLWPFDSHIVATQNIGSGAGQQSVVVSKASQNLRSIQTFSQSQAGLGNQFFLKNSTFSNPGLIDIQYRIGSNYYPAFTSVGENRAFMDLQNAFGSPGGSWATPGIIDNYMYYLSSSAAARTATMNNAGTANAIVNPINEAWLADCWMHAYCFDKLKRAKLEGVDLDGVNTLTSSGSQIVVQLNANVPANQVLHAVVRFTRVLQVANGSTRVIG